MISRQIYIAYVLFIFFLCLFAHHTLPSHPWTYDDLDHITAAKQAQSDWTKIFNAETKEPTRWVLNIYYYVVYKIFGENPAGYHTVNIPLHACNAVLCAYLVLTLFRQPLLSGLTGFLFVIHCAPYEAIYKISATGILFGTSAAILSILFTKQYLDTQRITYALGASFAYAVAIFSYESLLSACIPALYLWWKHTSRTVIFPILFLAPLFLFVLFDTAIYETTHQKVTFNALSIGWHILYNFGFFIARLFINAYFTPFGWDGPPPFDVGVAYFDAYAIIGWGIFVLLIILSFCNTTLQFATLWILATILPYIFSANQFYFSRYWYLPSIGGALLIAWIINKICLHFTKKAYKIIFLICFLVTISYFSLHKTNLLSGRFLHNAATYYMTHRHEAKKAIQFYKRAHNDYHFDLSFFYLNLASAYTLDKQWDNALQNVEIAVQKHPNDSKTYRLWGYVLYQQKSYDKAIDAYTTATQLDNAFISDLHELANRLYQTNHNDQALKAYQNILIYHPGYDQIHTCYFNISQILFLADKREQAIQILQELLAIMPDYDEAQNFLNQLLQTP